jgi:hypothetical protein
MAYEKSLSPDHTQRRAGSCRTLFALHFVRKLKSVDKINDEIVAHAAEDFMKSIQAQPGFAAVVIKLLTATGLDNNVLQIAAIHFKNFVRNNWRVRSFTLGVRHTLES